MTNDYNDILLEEELTLPSSNEKRVNLIINDVKLTNERYSEDDNIYLLENKPNFFYGGQDFGKKLFNPIKVTDSFYTKTQKWLGHVVEINEGGLQQFLKT